MKPFRLTPAYKDYLWGGDKLKSEYGKTSPGSIAESWELSAHPDGQSIIATGEFQGMGFGAFADEYPDQAGCGRNGFPLLIKLIDAAQSLSIQVHPNDDYSRRVEQDAGKTEMWYILDSEPGAYIYHGFKEPVTRGQMEHAIADESITDLLRRVEVSKGDVAFIPAGTIHAIGAGLVIAEVQQSSNATYRVYDFGRVGHDGKKRDLHIQKALDVTLRQPASPTPPGAGRLAQTADYTLTRLAKCRYFTADSLQLDGVYTYDAKGFVSVLCLDGGGELRCSGEILEFAKGDSIFIPVGSGDYTLKGRGEILLTGN